MSSTRYITVVGDNTIDRFRDESDLDLVGGNALNVAVRLSMLGHRVAYFGVVGDDAEGRLVLEEAGRRGVDLAGVDIVQGATALTCIRHTAEGDRFFESEDFGVTGSYVPSDAAVATIAGADWVHLGMVPDAEALRARIIARNPAARISQDCSVSSGWTALEVGFASAGEDPARAVEILAEGLAQGVPLVVATLGSRGALAGSADAHWQVPAVATQVVDTTGAGDSFMTGFISRYLESPDVDAALAAGAAHGSATCLFRGGWPQLPADIAAFG